MLYVKWRSFCPGLDVLNTILLPNHSVAGAIYNRERLGHPAVPVMATC